MSQTKEEKQKEKQDKVKYKGFYGENTVEVTFPDGTKRRVNKFEAKKLQEKFTKAKK